MTPEARTSWQPRSITRKEVFPGYQEYLDCIDEQLSRLFLEDSRLHVAARDALTKGGKRLRAVLALLWCQAMSGSYQPAIPVAVAYELAHTAALVQDDIIDRSHARRGTLTVEARYGLAEAILTANLLLFEIPKKIAEYSLQEGSRTKMHALLAMIGETCKRTTIGEYLDQQLARKRSASVEEYLEMVKHKTGALLAAPAACGAIVGGGTSQEVDTAYQFGERLGVSYQVRDDVLDIMGEEALLGKPIFNDLRNRKKNILLVLASKRASAEQKRLLRRLSGRRTFGADEIGAVRSIVKGSGAVDAAMDLASRFSREARSLLGTLKSSVAKDRLLKLSEQIIRRHY